MSNPVVRWQIITPAADKTSDFYCKVFGWQASRDNMLNYQAIDTGSDRGIHGGIWPAPSEAPSFAILRGQARICRLNSSTGAAFQPFSP